MSAVYTLTAFSILLSAPGCSEAPSPSPPTEVLPAQEKRESTAVSKELMSEVSTPIGTVATVPILPNHMADALGMGVTSYQEALDTAAALALFSIESKKQGIDLPDSASSMSRGLHYLDAATAKNRICLWFPEHQLKTLYGRMKKKMIHPHVFHVVDAQFICCPRDQHPCAENEAWSTCMENGQNQAKILAATWNNKPGKDPEETWKNAQTKEMGVNSYRFAYDYERPVDDQGGNWVLVDPGIRKAVKNAQAGSLVGPIKSTYGWHLLFIRSHSLPENLAFEAPEAQRRLKDELCKQNQQRMRRQLLQDIMIGKTVKEAGPVARSMWRAHSDLQENATP